MNHFNYLNETEIVIFEDDRIKVYSQTDSDTESESSVSIIHELEYLLEEEVDIYKPTKWDERRSYRHRPDCWRWSEFELARLE